MESAKAVKHLVLTRKTCMTQETKDGTSVSAVRVSKRPKRSKVTISELHRCCCNSGNTEGRRWKVIFFFLFFKMKHKPKLIRESVYFGPIGGTVVCYH